MRKIAWMTALLVLLTVFPAYAEGMVQIALSDEGITVNGAPVTDDTGADVYAANDIVFYLADQGFTYGEGTAEDEHEQAEADAHTVLHITAPGTYEISGKLSKGQIAVDLGEDAADDLDAVVTLVLRGVDIDCDVAPAIIFYNVYEPCSDDEDQATKDVDTSAAGANIVIADGSENRVEGAYVARIYRSYELNEAGTEVVDSKKLHKYDGAVHAKMSLNVYGGETGDGVLNIFAENEGLCSDLHMTIDGGNINIVSGDDGINTSEDSVSVCTVNGGSVNIVVNGAKGEGDGIDSNGWLVINGGSVTSAAYGGSMDSGIDSDMGIHINGGTVAASGNMLDAIAGSAQNYAVFTFAQRQKGGTAYQLKDESGAVVGEWTPANDFTSLIVSAENIVPGTYTFWQDDMQLAGAQGEMRGMTPPDGMGFPKGDRNAEKMDGFRMPPDGKTPEKPEGREFLKDGERPEMPEGGFDGRGFGWNRGLMQEAERSAEFVIAAGGNMFSMVAEAEQ